MSKTLQMVILSGILTFFTSTGIAFVLCDYYSVTFTYEYSLYMMGALIALAMIKSLGGENEEKKEG